MKIHSSKYTITVNEETINTLIEKLKTDEAEGTYYKRGYETMSEYIDSSCIALVSSWDHVQPGAVHEVAGAISNHIKSELSAAKALA